MTKLTYVRRVRSARGLLLAAVLAAMPVIIAPTARAQQQINANGTALDANNRLGSNGVNTYRPAPTAGLLGNQIVNGNVSNGREFRVRAPYSDPTEFNGLQVNSTIGNFEKNSVGIGTPYGPTQAPNVSTPFYSESRFAAPPPQAGAFVNAPNSPGYVPANPNNVVLSNDQRLGARLDATGVQGDLPKPGELVLPGPVDPQSSQRTIFTASALTGVRPWNSSDVNTLEHFAQYSGMTPENVLARLDLNSTDVMRMRKELQQTSAALKNGPISIPPNNGAVAAGATDNGVPNATASGQPLKASLANPLEAPGNAQLSSAPLDSALASNPLGANMSAESYYNRMLGEPAKQSKQYDELKKRLERYDAEHKDPAQASAEAFNKAVREKAAGENANNAQAGPVAPKPGAEVKPIPNAKPNKESATPKQPPVSIKSMTEGVQANGLKEMLAKAETQMKQGKFSSAIDTYTAAEQVAPNQPLIWIGRANAELAAAYYGRAEEHLKQAFKSDPALLMGQYDLRSFLGEERLTSVIKDLREIANTDTKSETSVFLLAYISYNTGNESRAAAYLDLADKRSGGNDPIFKSLRDHWSLPPAGAKEINK